MEPVASIREYLLIARFPSERKPSPAEQLSYEPAPGRRLAMRQWIRTYGIALFLTLVLPVAGALRGPDPVAGPSNERVSKAPPAILVRLRQGLPQEVTVVFDDRGVQEEALARRVEQHLPFEDDE